MLVFDTSAVKRYFNVTSNRVHDQRKESKSSATNRNYDLQRKKTIDFNHQKYLNVTHEGQNW